MKWKKPRRAHWVVVSVEKTSRVEEVFCATVEGVGAFGLADGLMTGNCFFQRKYEWAGLLEHHPDLFSKAQELEEKLGNDRQRKPFTWIAGEPLSYIRRTADPIREKRAIQVIEDLDSMSMKKDPSDLLSVTSCGLLCGK